jgi:DNA polymerase III subunit gamma/tau
MYQVLAHKWRPKTLSQVVGQNAVLQILKNSLNRNKLHHAYLFTGVRGIGKTTIARVFAKCLNCAIGITDTPCDACESCININQGNCIDVIEVDAASRTRVEDTKDLLANVQYLPVSSRFKIYIIDEVHMLSNHSFNALLKTLEEPPEHVKFLFATTDPQKLPATIISRCLQFKLRKFAITEIADHLIHVLTAENCVFTKDAIYMIAKAADGSMRDALTMLEQVVAFGDNNVKVNCIQEILGIPNIENIYSILSSVLQQNTKQALEIIDILAKNTSDFVKILQELQAVLHRIAILQEVPDIYNQDPDVFGLDILKSIADHIKPEQVQLYYQIAINGLKDLPYASDLKSGFEMVILRMIAFSPVKIAQNNCKNYKIEELAKKIEPEIIVEKKLETSISQISIPNWLEVVAKLNLQGFSRQLAHHCTITAWDNNGVVELNLDASRATIATAVNKAQLQAALCKYLSKNIKLIVNTGKQKTETPAMQISKINQQKHQLAADNIHSDPIVQQILKEFDGNIEEIKIID